MSIRKITLAIAIASLASPVVHAEYDINLLNAFTSSSGARSGSAEILAYSSHQNTVLSTLAGSDGYGVQVLSLGASGSLTERGLIDFGTAFGTTSDINSASSTSIDPLGRGFGVVSLIPTNNGSTQGKLGFFDYRSGSLGVISTLDVGFHPDNVKFSKDGNRLFIANEGELTVGGDNDAAGSVSIVDLSSISSIADVSSLNSSHVSTFDFQAANLAMGVSLAGLRINDKTATELYRHIEPEYITELDKQLYVSLQENNAVGVFDLASNKWTAIHDLGTIKQTIDASDKDGALINDVVAGMPMPDTIASFSNKGNKYIVTANEGDFRGDDADRVRVKDIDSSDIDDATEAKLNALYDGDFTADDALGRLRVSNIDGDIDGDGDIDVLTMPGTRSMSIWNATTGELVSDTGSLEALLLSLDPDKHNMNGDLSDFDKRSDDKGPEPEALFVAEIDGKQIAIVGMERQNGLLLFDVTDPTSPFFVGYENSFEEGLVSPESLLLINAEDNPTGKIVLLAGYENNGGGIGVYSVGASPVPVPSAFILMITALGGLVSVNRQRKLKG